MADGAVLDASALLALLQGEVGADRVAGVLQGAVMSAVNLAEVAGKLCERGVPPDRARAALESLGIEIVSFDVDQAWSAGQLRPVTRAAGLSLGDRACLALGAQRGARILTADRGWVTLLPRLRVEVIR